MKSLLVFAIALMASLSLAQETGGTGGSPVHPKHSAGAGAQKDLKPVTYDEARTTFLKLDRLLAAGLQEPVTHGTKIPEGTAPVTRTQVVKEFTRIFLWLKPHFKFAPNATQFDASVLKMKDPTALSNLRTMIRFGCVAPVGPLATGPNDSMTVHEFGDAVGFFVARLAELTHMPTPKWTPILGSGGGS